MPEPQANAAQQQPVKPKTPTHIIIKKIMMWLNIIIALIVIGYGIYEYTGGDINSFDAVFIPFYLILFGFLLFCAEVEWLWMVKYFKFADNFFGRGIYNIFLATMVMSSLTELSASSDSSDGSTSSKNIFVIVLSSILAAVGFLEILFYIINCGGKSEKFQNYDKELQQQLLLQEKQQQANQKLSQQQLQTMQALQTVQTSQPNLTQLQSNPAEYLVWLNDQLAITQNKINQNQQI